MADHPNVDAKIQRAAPYLRQVPATLRVAADIPDDNPKSLDEALLARLHAAAISLDAEACKRTIKCVVAEGTLPEDLADFYIPSIARTMGDLWCEDELSFASVTIGTSRLQAMLRVLGPDFSDAHANQSDAPAVLLVVPQDIYHTLGAIVLSGQLRRKGLSVKLVLGGRAEDIAARVRRTRYDAIFLSSSRGETLESLRRIIDAVRGSASNTPPIVVGGSILEVETVQDVMALTGADYATRLPQEALRLCGLRDSTQNGVTLMQEG